MNDADLRKYFHEDLEWPSCPASDIAFEFLCNAAREVAGGVLLDAGAGYQPFKPFFEDSLYLAVEHPIAGAQNKNIEEYDILCDVNHIPLTDECIDLVLSTASFEHLHDPQGFVKESYRVLRPGGSLWIFAPFMYEEHEVPFDFQRPTSYGLLRDFKGAGFERVEVQPASSSIYAATYWLKYAIRQDARRRFRGVRGAKPIRWLLRKSSRAYCWLVMKILDGRPSTETKAPIGWVSWGYKVGTRPNGHRSWESVGEFLEQHALRRTGVVVTRDSIVDELVGPVGPTRQVEAPS